MKGIFVAKEVKLDFLKKHNVKAKEVSSDSHAFFLTMDLASQ